MIIIVAGIAILFIIIIIAAVIAAFVFGMAGNISKTKVVAVTATKTDSRDIIVTDQGGQDQSSLVGISVTTPGDPVTGCASSGTLVDNHPTCGISYPTIGSTITLTGNYSGSTEIIAVGKFNDGTNQVLLDANI